MANETDVFQKMDDYGREGIPFLFAVDFEKNHPFVVPLQEVDNSNLLFRVNGVTNMPPSAQKTDKPLYFQSVPVSKKRYCEAFGLVQQHIGRGDSFLLNLTMPSEIKTNFTLKEIFLKSDAPYKLWFKEQMVVFSPETFIKTEGERIRSFPMKGTMDAALPDARNRLLSSRKELAEHYTIVDLIRNDLSIVAKGVTVERFRYIDRVKTHRKELLQMSSEISGVIRDEYRSKPGSVMKALLPAGSISGAPKKKTLEIIRSAEKYQRGWYSGVFGIFDGQNIDSGVMIRYIEQHGGKFYYKSGGGITALSNCEEEYKELTDKIYVPFS